MVLVAMLKNLPTILRVNMLHYLVKKYQEISSEPEYTLEKPVCIRRRTILSYSQSDIYHNFRFRSTEQLQQLFSLLDFPEAVLLKNNVILRGEEVFLFGLRR
jgi:hypothetical protein